MAHPPEAVRAAVSAGLEWPPGVKPGDRCDHSKGERVPQMELIWKLPEKPSDTDENRLQGRMHLRVKSLGGVMTTAKGKTLVLTIFVNDVVLPQGVTSAREGKAIGKLCELIYQHAP